MFWGTFKDKRCPALPFMCARLDVLFNCILLSRFSFMKLQADFNLPFREDNGWGKGLRTTTRHTNMLSFYVDIYTYSIVLYFKLAVCKCSIPTPLQNNVFFIWVNIRFTKTFSSDINKNAFVLWKSHALLSLKILKELLR